MLNQSSPLLNQLSQLQQEMREQLRFQIQNLRLELRSSNEIVLQGHARSYHHKQLAQELVIKKNYTAALSNEIFVT